MASQEGYHILCCGVNISNWAQSLTQILPKSMFTLIVFCSTAGVKTKYSKHGSEVFRRVVGGFKKDVILTSFCTNICLTLPLPKSEVTCISHQSQSVSIITISTNDQCNLVQSQTKAYYSYE